jgi:hypothetical protein
MLHYIILFIEFIKHKFIQKLKNSAVFSSIFSILKKIFFDKRINNVDCTNQSIILNYLCYELIHQKLSQFKKKSPLYILNFFYRFILNQRCLIKNLIFYFKDTKIKNQFYDVKNKIKNLPKINCEIPNQSFISMFYFYKKRNFIQYKLNKKRFFKLTLKNSMNFHIYILLVQILTIDKMYKHHLHKPFHYFFLNSDLYFLNLHQNPYESFRYVIQFLRAE